MKKSNIAIASLLGLVIPFTVIAAPADDEVTIRMMKMNEYSSDKVTQNIELPAKASDQATGLVRNINQTRVRAVTGQEDSAAYAGNGSGEGLGGRAGDRHNEERYGQDSIEAQEQEAGIMDRDRDQDRSQIHDQDQDRIMDQDQDRTMEQDQDRLRDPNVEHESNEISSPENQPAEPAGNQHGSGSVH